MAFDPKKPVVTRNGLKATIIKTDLKDGQPIVAVVDTFEGGETIETYNRDGSFFRDGRKNALDLVNVKTKKTAWVNLYPCLSVTCYFTESAANYGAGEDRIACIPITYEE